MTKGFVRATLLMAGLTVLLGAAAMKKTQANSKAEQAAPRGALAPGETAKTVVARWPAGPRGAAELMLEKYGEPDQFDRDTLAWFNNGEWKRTVVHRAASRRDPSGRTKDFLEQTVGYLVPSEKIPDLNRFNPRLEVSMSAGEMSFSSESESKNRLALNLAEEIITGKRAVADARGFFDRTNRLAASGKSSSYLDKLQFDADNRRYMTPTGADR